MSLQVAHGLEMRPAVLGEAERLSELALRSKAFWGYDQGFMRACSEELAVKRGAILNGCVFVIAFGKEIAGFYLLEPLAPTRMELGMLFVDPDKIGCGYGRALLDHAKAEAHAMGATVLVIQSDPHAARFYERSGARLVGEQPSASIAGRMLPMYELALAP